MNKKAGLMQQIIIHLILIALIFGLFFLSTVEKANSNVVKQQILEKQTALLIDSAIPNTKIMIAKVNLNGKIDNVELKSGRVFFYVNGLTTSKGYPYFSRYSVTFEQDEINFYIKIK